MFNVSIETTIGCVFAFIYCASGTYPAFERRLHLEEGCTERERLDRKTTVVKLSSGRPQPSWCRVGLFLARDSKRENFSVL